MSARIVLLEPGSSITPEDRLRIHMPVLAISVLNAREYDSSWEKLQKLQKPLRSSVPAAKDDLEIPIAIIDEDYGRRLPGSKLSDQLIDMDTAAI